MPRGVSKDAAIAERLRRWTQKVAQLAEYLRENDERAHHQWPLVEISEGATLREVRVEGETLPSLIRSGLEAQGISFRGRITLARIASDLGLSRDEMVRVLTPREGEDFLTAETASETLVDIAITRNPAWRPRH